MRSIYPSAGYSYIDSFNNLSTPALLKTGDAPSRISRWADFSTTVVDANDIDFWTNQTYAPAGSAWATWWSKSRHAARRRADVRSAALAAEDSAQSSERAFHFLAVAVDFVRPSAELFERDRGGLVEVVAVEEDLADDAAEDAGADSGASARCRRGRLRGSGRDSRPARACRSRDRCRGT